jgi:hypothetical protein
VIGSWKLRDQWPLNDAAYLHAVEDHGEPSLDIANGKILKAGGHQTWPGASSPATA